MANKRRQVVDDAELKRRRAQSQRDKARNRREEVATFRAITRGLQRTLAQVNKPTQLVVKTQRIAVPDGNRFNISHASIMGARSDKFMRDIAGLFNNTKYSDARILIRDVILPVHKSVICIQSEYFEKAFQESFIEGSSGELGFNEGSGAAHWRVLEYMYTGDYSDDLSSNFEDDPPLLKDPRVYALADMFFLEDLKALSTIKMQKKLQTLWTCDSFPDCIREIYASTPNSDHAMRSAVIEVARVHVRELGKKAIFKDLIREGGEFAVDFFESITYGEPLETESLETEPWETPQKWSWS
ncbi:hypothetical protein P154DRAFT_462410 [Amniculicola lignicola CBS 123094]|uniref:BTB domain-containing protein n=1 Tax=Amniculicola lignicola CBS 123094 TaxID=1392246 RepID=A0A6A5WKP4_9PLEO|nr:hypothetical protein P154DRAFT_462410 [Amniculicola lignicola CBS 123094]